MLGKKRANMQRMNMEKKDTWEVVLGNTQITGNSINGESVRNREGAESNSMP